ncbi:MAG: hypothetical protein IJM55_05655 [Ruminococcus sp.]|nr:hypothetical protein [Ruminococcus sp.]
MSTKVIGISESGPSSYQGHPFHNLVLHVEVEDRYTEGKRAEQLKVKYSRLNEIFNLGKSAAEVELLHPKDFVNLVGKSVSVYYDKFRNVDTIIVHPDESDNKSGK